MIIRHPHPDEAGRVCALFEDEVRAGRMLPRQPEQVRAHPDDWLVADVDGALAGCVSLVFFNPALAEIRSLAVAPDYRGRGLARALIGAALELATCHEVRRVLALTRAVGLFERAGFHVEPVSSFPEKVWRDCRACPLRHACDETAVIRDLQPGTMRKEDKTPHAAVLEFSDCGGLPAGRNPLWPEA